MLRDARHDFRRWPMKPRILTQADFANLSLLAHSSLQRVLEAATVVSSDSVPADAVTMNTQVVLSDDKGGQQLVRVVYPTEADAAPGLISVVDALGTALLGASLGDIVECNLPDGPYRLRVDKVAYQPESDLRTRLVTTASPATGS
jgi:regulator of nucleoside diphosphate kinase